MLAIYVCVNKKFKPLFQIFYNSYLENSGLTDMADFYCFCDDEVSYDLSSEDHFRHVIFREAETTKLDNYSSWTDDFFYGMSIKAFALKTLMEEGYSRVIYFDVDMIINGSLVELANIDLHGKAVGGVPDICYHRWANKPDDSHITDMNKYRNKLLGADGYLRYINSGMFIADVDKLEWLDYDTFANKHKPLYVDQDWLNVMANDVQHIPERWNYMCDLAFQDQLTPEQRVIDNIKMGIAHVQHFHGDAKPWMQPSNRSNKLMLQMNTEKLFEMADKVDLSDEWLYEDLCRNRPMLERSNYYANGFNGYTNNIHSQHRE